MTLLAVTLAELSVGAGGVAGSGVVTGGTAIRLASDGMAVAVLDLNEADCQATVKEIENAGGRALAVGADVSQTDQVNAAPDRDRSSRAAIPRRLIFRYVVIWIFLTASFFPSPRPKVTTS